MSLDKKKYSKKEVEQLLSTCAMEYQEKLNNQRTKISFLIEENKRLAENVAEFKKKDALISSTLLSAREKADEIEKSILNKYALVVEMLKKFSNDWKAYFDFLKEKYPNYDTIQKSVKLKEALDNALLLDDDKQTVEEMEEKLSKITSKIAFNPKGKVEDYIAVTSENGFSLEDVLNPGKLELEDLCKELGLME